MRVHVSVGMAVGRLAAQKGEWAAVSVRVAVSMRVARSASA